MTTKPISMLDPAILGPTLRDAVVKLDPRQLIRNPVIFVTEVVAALVTVLFVQDLMGGAGAPAFTGQIALWLWFTVLFATFAEAVAEGRGKAQAESLKRGKSDLIAKKLLFPDQKDNRGCEVVPATALKVGDIVLVEVNDLVPGSAHQAMLVVGVVEVVAGLAVAFAPRFGALLVAAWLGGIIVNLVSMGEFYDVALRDFGLLVGALALAALAFDRSRARR